MSHPFPIISLASFLKPIKLWDNTDVKCTAPINGDSQPRK